MSILMLVYLHIKKAEIIRNHQNRNWT